IAQGLDYLHSMNIVHGDLRGSNILISDDYHACISGFALTTILEDDPDTSASDSPRTEGSVPWMAPELLDPERFGCERSIKTPATDVYAFACVCIELQTGAPPFGKLVPVVVILRVITAERPERPGGLSDGMWSSSRPRGAEDFRQRPNTKAILSSLEQ
ncbi:kinase-like domain-containing protein, partial [Mycena olivaceomarginata]